MIVKSVDLSGLEFDFLEIFLDTFEILQYIG